jgi:4'-phosphopantetheinyl transferase
VFPAIHRRPTGRPPFEVIVACLDEPIPTTQRVLSAEEQERAARLRFECDRRRFINARCRLRQILAQRLHAPPSSVALETEASGRPRLTHGGLHFSVSRTRNVAAFALSASSKLGIDIEFVRELPEADAIAASLFTRVERAACRRFGFLYCWTRREALAKALQLPVDRRDAEVPRGWVVESFCPLPGYIAALAIEAQKKP